MLVDADAYERARRVAADIRAFTRDRFTPGSLESLNELQHEVTEKVYSAIITEKNRHA